MRVLPVVIAGLTSLVITAPPSQAATIGGQWALDESGTAATAADSSGNGNTGFNANIIGDGEGYLFNGVDSNVTVPNSASLNPGSNDFQFGVTVESNLPAPGTDYDLLRKGLMSTVGGDYKVEILNVNGLAKVLCFVKDSQKHVAKVRWSPKGGLNLGVRHTITCSKTSTGVTLKLDSYAPRSQTLSTPLGSVSNTASLFLGVKSASGGDELSGELFDAFVR